MTICVSHNREPTLKHWSYTGHYKISINISIYLDSILWSQINNNRRKNLFKVYCPYTFLSVWHITHLEK